MNYKSLIAYLGQNKYRSYSFDPSRFIIDDLYIEGVDERNYWNDIALSFVEGLELTHGVAMTLPVRCIFNMYRSENTDGFSLFIRNLGEYRVLPEPRHYTMYDKKTKSVIFCMDVIDPHNVNLESLAMGIDSSLEHPKATGEEVKKL